MREAIAELLIEIFVHSFKSIGAAIRWVFLKNKYTFDEILEQGWNHRIGALFALFVILMVLYFNFS